MTQYLPGNLLALFTARPPIPFKPPPKGLTKRANSHVYSGIADFISNFEVTPPPPATRGETREEKEERRRQEKIEETNVELNRKLALWDPHSDPNASGDPFKTLFVARINYDTTESKLRRELESYGSIRRIHLVYNHMKRKPRGYAFVEYDHERDMQSAFKHADGKKIDGRRIVVDVERGRTVKSWRPRRLGGGLGGTRRGGPDENIRHSGRVDQYESRGERGERGDRDKERDRGDREERRERRRSRSPRDRDRRERGDRGDRDKSSRRRERGERGGDRDEERSERRRERRERDRDREKHREEREPRPPATEPEVKKEVEEYPDNRDNEYERYEANENGAPLEGEA